jgi:hypothetical protein
MFTESLAIPNALRLGAQSVNALLKGDIVAAIPRTFTNVGKSFALYPDQPDANTETVTIKAWARCELCDIIDGSKSLEIISDHIAIPMEKLQEIITERESFFLIYLRVYRLPKPISIPAISEGQYIPLPDRIQVNELSPVLSDRDFARLKQQLENLEPREPLVVKIQRMLEEAEIQQEIELSNKLNWINTIKTLGDRSIELEEKKTAYQAGTDFENIVKKGLEFIGFTIDESQKGGAGGLDLFCSKPYPVAGECKAGKSIPDESTEQLNRIARRHLKNYHLAVGLIIGAAEPSKQLKESAIRSRDEVGIKFNIIKAMTLQKLAELKAKYDGAIDLFELKKYMQAGQIDEKIDEYIQKVEGEIKLRSHIVQAVRELQADSSENPAPQAIRVQYNATLGKDRNPKLDDREVHDLLLELSSPLAGYLGREKSNSNWRGDRFYFLRDLPI